MNSSRIDLSDQQIKSALMSREVLAGARVELIADVMERVLREPPQAARQGAFRIPRVPFVFVGGALLIGLLGAAAFLGGARPPFGPDAGTIIYTSSNAEWAGGVTVSDRAISEIASDGTGQTRLAPVPGAPIRNWPVDSTHRVQVEPAVRVSPDGTMIAMRLKGDEPGIYVMNRDGSNLRRLAEARESLGQHGNQPPGNASFAWSPDSSRIAFISPLQPAWPPLSGSDGQLYVVDVATGSTTQISPSANGSVAWSPDGSQIAYGRSAAPKSHVLIINADGSNERMYTSDYRGAAHPGAIAWSPDGSRVAFAEHRFSGEPEGDYLVSIDADAGDAEVLAYLGHNGCCYHGAHGGQLEWSPDGRSLAVPTYATPPYPSSRPVIRIVAADASRAPQDIDGEWFDWSPDGSQLVVVRAGPLVQGTPEADAGSTSSIYVVDVDGGDARWIADGDYPTWAP